MKLDIRDPFIILGVVILVAGLILFTYGFLPLQQPKYNLTASGGVPASDVTGNFITNPEQYFSAKNAQSGPFDRVDCYPATGGWECYGYQFTGMQTVYSESSRYYGVGMIGLGLLSIVVANRLKPIKKPENLSRQIRVRVDEDICVANGVCVALAPTVFQLRKQDFPTIFAPLAYVLDPAGADNDTILLAAQMCPTGAIIIEDAKTGERIHPPPPKI